MNSLTLDEKKKEKPPLHVYPEIKIQTHFFSHHGLDSTRYNGVNALTGPTVLMASGRFVMFVNIHSGVIESIPGPEDGGVSAVAVHPSRQFFVVCERARSDPLVRVYEWPSRHEAQCFRGGAVRGFSACSFSADGNMMATVSTAPDFSLAVWNWETRGMILRSKCTATDVYSVVFSQFDSGRLVTGGAGHVKFWTMATTFTGQKLQGLLGKFGRLEISNISGFVVLSDGKVLSGSEGGCILLWEGDLVRCCFAREIHPVGYADMLAVQDFDYTPCHDGTIHVVVLLDGAQVLLTAGDDGYMRYWSVNELDAAEGEGAPPLYAPDCLLEILVDPSACIRAVTHCRDTNEWAVLDSKGAIWRVPYMSPDDILQGKCVNVSPAVPALRFNGGGITSAALSPRDHTIVTGGEDATIRLVDYLSSRELYRMRLEETNAVVALRFFLKDQSGNTFLACTGNGTVLLLRRKSEAFKLLGQWRPHRNGILALAVDRAEGRVCTVTSEGMAFFFNVAPDFSALHPIGFCTLPLGEVTCAAWDDAADSVLVGFASGRLLAVRALVTSDIDHSVGFEAPCTYSLVALRQRKMRESTPANDARALEKADEGIDDEDSEDANVGPWPLRCVAPLPDGTFAIGAGGSELLYSYAARVRYAGRTDLPPLPPTGIEPPDYVEEPLANLCYRDCTPTALSLSASGRVLVVLCDGAEVLLRPIDTSGTPTAAVSAAQRAHDGLDGLVAAAGVSFDDTMCVSVASDGLVVAQLRDGCAKPQIVAAPRVALRAEECVPPKALSLSIQQQKEEDDRRRAEEAKQRELDAFLAKLHVLHARYADLLEKNEAAPEAARLKGDEAALHPQIAAELAEERKRRIAEARIGTALEIAREDVRTRKMRNRFIDNLLFDRLVVRSFSREFFVASFRIFDPSKSISQFEEMIAELRLEDMASKSRRDTDLVSPNGDSDSDGDDDDSGGGGSGRDGPNWSRRAKSDEAEEATAAAAAADRAGSTAGAGESLPEAMRQYFDKMDERRAERARRRAGHEALLQRRPAETAEARRLRREVARAVARRGECVLRMDPAYHAGHQQQQPSAAAKLEQLVALETLLVELRSGFNARLTAMRNEKAELCESLNKWVRRMAEIDAALPSGAAAVEFALASDECPEKRFTADRAALDAFAEELAQARAREELAKKAQRGFGADLAAGARRDGDRASGSAVASTSGPVGAGEESSLRRASGARRGSRLHRSMSISGGAALAPRLSRQHSAMAAAALVRERMDQDVRAKLDNVKLTEAEEEEAQAHRERLMAERRHLAARVRHASDVFDAKLWRMYEERARVDADLCLAHTRALLLFREYQILLVFRQRDRELQAQHNEARASRDGLRVELSSQHETARGHVTALERLNETARSFRGEAEAFIEANFPAEHVPYITRVFLRQIKRRRHGGDADDDDDDVTSDDDDEDEDVVDDDIGEEVCPPNCSEERWLDVLARRETRLDHVDAAHDLRRQQEALQRAIEKHTALAAEKDAAVAQCRRDIADFQSEKQRQLNMLDTFVALHCGQVRCLDGATGRCPATFRRDDLVVVSDDVVAGLRQRIARLADEKRESAAQLRAMAADQAQRHRARREWAARNAQWEERIYDAMLLKFGQVVDLELLESASGNRVVEEMRERLRAEEMRCEDEIRRRDKRIAALRKELQSGLERNTHLLHDLGDQEDDKQGVDRSLSQATQKVVSKIYDGTNVATAADRESLRLLIAAQKEEIDALQAEVQMLRRKGGYVYAPAKPFMGTV